MTSHDAVVLVRATYGSTKKSSYSVGTGCFVDERIVLTAAHVVPEQIEVDGKTLPRTRIDVRIARGDARDQGGRWVAAELAWPGTPELDAALLRVDATRAVAFPDPVPLVAGRVGKSEKLDSCAYPAATSSGGDGSASLHASLSGTVHPEHEGMLQITVDDAPAQFASEEWPGASGMPVLVERDGKHVCVGVAFEVFTALPQKFQAVPTRRLFEDDGFARIVRSPKRVEHRQRVRNQLDVVLAQHDAFTTKLAEFAKCQRPRLAAELLQAPLLDVLAWVDNAQQRCTGAATAAQRVVEILLPAICDVASRRLDGPALIDIAACSLTYTEIAMAALDCREIDLVEADGDLRGAAGHFLSAVGLLGTSAPDRRNFLERLAKHVDVRGPLPKDIAELARKIEAAARIRLGNAGIASVGERDVAPFYVVLSDVDDASAIENFFKQDLGLRSVHVVVRRDPLSSDEHIAQEEASQRVFRIFDSARRRPSDQDHG